MRVGAPSRPSLTAETAAWSAREKPRGFTLSLLAALLQAVVALALVGGGAVVLRLTAAGPGGMQHPVGEAETDEGRGPVPAVLDRRNRGLERPRDPATARR
jgi:hypothetical protein